MKTSQHVYAPQYLDNLGYKYYKVMDMLSDLEDGYEFETYPKNKENITIDTIKDHNHKHNYIFKCTPGAASLYLKRINPNEI